jgi:hypothetical protein
MKTTKLKESTKTEPESKPAQLAKIMYTGLVRLKATKEAQKSGRNHPIRLDFGQPERVNATELDQEEINDKNDENDKNR